MNKNEETAIARKYFCYFMLLWIVVAAIYGTVAEAQERRWVSTAYITYDDQRVLPLLEYAEWSVSGRANHRVVVSHMAFSSERGYIHVSVVPQKTIDEMRGKTGVLAFVRPWVLTAAPSVMSRAEMFIAEQTLSQGCAQRLVVHELIHAMGVSGHAADTHDVMYPDLLFCLRQRYTMSRADIAMLDGAGYDAAHCWGEINKRGDLFVPAVGGYGAELVLRDGYFTLGESRETGSVCGGSIDNGIVTIRDIRTFSGQRYSGSLSFDGERFTVLDVEEMTPVRSVMALEDADVYGEEMEGEIVE